MNMLTYEMVILGAHASDKVDAIRQAGELLVKAGYVAPSYVEGMLAREEVISTYLGNGIAIPHGEITDMRFVYRTGMSILQLPEGVDWEPGERAYLVIGLAATGHEHIPVLSNLLELVQAAEPNSSLIQATDPMVIIERLTR
jgi:phosphocarrier protein FPr